MLCIWVITFFAMGTAFQGRNYEIEDLGENPGIYFERAEDIFFTKATWKILIGIDLKNSHIDVEYYKKVLEELDSTCDNSEYPGQCGNMAKTFRHLTDRISDLKEDAQELQRGLVEFEIPKSDVDGYSRTVAKRSGVVAIVGSMAKFLYGTLTDEDGRRIFNHFVRMAGSVRRMMSLPSDQTHLISKKVTRNDAELDQLKKTLEEGVAQLNASWKHINHLSEGWQILLYSSRLVAVTNSILLEFDEMKETYQKTKEIINAAKLGQLHPDLIEATQLAEIISDVRKTFPEWRFPIAPGQSRSGDLSKIAKTTVGYEGNQLVVQIIVPVIEPHPTELYQIHEIPIAQEGTTSAANIASRKQNIAISFDKKRYTYLSNTDLSKCLKLRRTKICKNEAPWMNAEMDLDCEAMLLHQPSANSLKTCPITVRENFKGFWTYLKPSNSWLFSVPDQTRVLVTCREGIADGASIKGVGILRLKAGCSAIQGKYLLRTSPALQTLVMDTYKPKLQLNLLSLDSGVIKKGRKIRQFSEFSKADEIIESRRLEEIQGEYERLVNLIEEKEQFWRSNYGGIAISLITITMFLATGCITWIILGKRRSTGPPTQRLPSAQENPEEVRLRNPLSGLE